MKKKLLNYQRFIPSSLRLGYGKQQLKGIQQMTNIFFKKISLTYC